MKKTSLIVLVLVVVALIIWGFTKKEIAVAPTTTPNTSTENYSNTIYKFSLSLPSGFEVDENYTHQISPTRNISGVKFTIPKSMAERTNLSRDTAISIESIPNTSYCTAELFTYYPAQKPDIVEDSDTTYSIITGTDAGAGNRYEETIYAIPGTNPCIAIRYFIHYSAIQNYPEGTVKEFDHAAILKQFDRIRRSMRMK